MEQIFPNIWQEKNEESGDNEEPLQHETNKEDTNSNERKNGFHGTQIIEKSILHIIKTSHNESQVADNNITKNAQVEFLTSTGKWMPLA